MKINESCQRSIILAADDISKLRSPDVYRVMCDFIFSSGDANEMVDYISEHRPDLAAEAMACKLDIENDSLR